MAKILVRIVIGLIIAALLLLLADRIVANVFESKAADQVAEEAAEEGAWSSQRVDVDVAGFPFLTQVTRNDIDTMDIELSEVTYNSLTFEEFNLTARHLEADTLTYLGADGDITAQRVSGTAVLPLDGLDDVLLDDSDISFEQSGDDLTAHITTELLGRELNFTSDVDITQVSNGIEFSARNVRSADDTDLPSGVEELINRIADRLNTVVELPELPYGTTLDDLRVDGTKLHLDMSADDVQLR
ncbi:LmeA family phospholipid-binding protein [Haloglycomyces albus]|uniref:LmeA family phospholipid-binding protein n=1 Tax=Haloglycomyces albus TaxID=526067 RepID=UPI00046CCE3C|nr:DUF2993 domain-containing protein [Haloglycomyces albus]